LCMAGGPGLEPVWRSGPGDPDYTASARKCIVYVASGPKSVVRVREAPHLLARFPGPPGQLIPRKTKIYKTRPDLG
jgi:hypothetical protein